MPPRPDDDAPLLYSGASITWSMRRQLGQLARDLRPRLDRAVTQATLIRAAITFWLARAEPEPGPEVVEAVRTEHRWRSRAPAQRPAHALPLVNGDLVVSRAVMDRLDRLARALSPLDGRDVSRATLVRVAIDTWLHSVDLQSPELVESIRAELSREYRRSTAAAELHRGSVYLPQAMLDRVDALAIQARPTVGCEVSRAAIIRAALAPWLDQIERLDVQAALEEIRSAATPHGSILHRSKIAWSQAIRLRLASLRTKLGRSIFRTARKANSAFVLAALTPWLDDAERQPSVAFDAIRAALLKRGRKARR